MGLAVDRLEVRFACVSPSNIKNEVSGQGSLLWPDRAILHQAGAEAASLARSFALARLLLLAAPHFPSPTSLLPASLPHGLAFALPAAFLARPFHLRTQAADQASGLRAAGLGPMRLVPDVFKIIQEAVLANLAVIGVRRRNPDFLRGLAGGDAVGFLHAAQDLLLEL